MLLGSSAKKPSLDMIRRIKSCLQQALDLGDEAMITVTQLACLEDDCAPLETVVGLLQPGQPQRQHKIHKPTDAITPNDLLDVCEAWGYKVEQTGLNSLFKEN